MTEPPDIVPWYDAHAAALAPAYEALEPEVLYGWFADLLPQAPALVLDVGAGSGRDAAWLAGLGHDVVAVEPSAALRVEAERRHPGAAVRWMADRLPGLPAVHRLGLAFDLILLSGVWQHVAPGERARALRKLLGLLRPGGVLVLTLRRGTAEAERGMHPVSLAEVEQLARGHGAVVARTAETPDQLGRSEVTWTGVALRLPDDGTGALPLLRHLILNDQKSATYKLGLLRALCRAADGQAGLAEEQGEDAVLPLGLVALNWLRLYLPLVAAKLPQLPNNAGPDGLGFAGPGFRALLDGAVPRLELRVGARFAGAAAQAVRSALQEAADLIARMPATYLIYPNSGGPVLPTTRRLAPKGTGEVVLDAAFLGGFGVVAVPRELWRALGRFAAWVEPALVAEWQRLMRGYAERQGRTLDEGRMAAAMTWSEPSRDVALPRERALVLLSAGEALHCVWSGRKLEAGTLDIDHCLPWAAWPCGDLWNLLPAHRRVNQHDKRDRLPGDERLQTASEPIQGWWQRAYLEAGGAVLARRFADEARASLPGLGGQSAPVPELGEVFAALRVQRLRLHHDQQVPEWPLR